MKKFWLISIMFICLFLFGCWDDAQQVQQLPEQEVQKQQNEFAMKEKCAEYKDDFIQSTKNEYWISDEIYSENWFNLNDDSTFVFYSPVRNSCVWAYDIYSTTENWWSIYYEITDLLSNEVILSTHQIENNWKWVAVLDQSYRNAYLDTVYDLQWYPECYCREMDICWWQWWDWCDN